MSTGRPIRPEVIPGFIVSPDFIQAEYGRDCGAGGRICVWEVDFFRGASDLFGMGPVRDRCARHIRLDFGQGHACSIGRDGPLLIIVVREFVHESITLVDQAQGFAVVAQVARIGRVCRQAAFLHDDVLAGINDGAAGKGVVDALNSPAGHIRFYAHLIEEFDPLSVLAAARWVVVNFVKNDYGIGGCMGC